MHQGTTQKPYRKMATATEVFFTAPEGLELEGDSGESLIKWKKSGDRYEILSVDGVPLSKDMEDSADEMDDSKMDSASPTEDDGSEDAPTSGY